MNHWLRWRPSFPLFTPNGCWCEQMKTARRSHQTHLFTLRQLQRTRASALGGGRELGRSAATRPGSWSVITLSDDPLITARQSAHSAGGFPSLCPSRCLSISWSITSSTSTSGCDLVHLPAPDPNQFDLSLDAPIHSSPDLSIYRSSHPSIHPSTFPSIHLDISIIHPVLYPLLDQSFSRGIIYLLLVPHALDQEKRFYPSLDPSVSWCSLSWSTSIWICLIASLSISQFVHLSICLLKPPRCSSFAQILTHPSLDAAAHLSSHSSLHLFSGSLPPPVHPPISQSIHLLIYQYIHL